MSIPKKGSRKIVVGDVEYRWLIRKKPTYGQAIDELNSNLTAAIELYANSGSTLVVTFPFNRPDSWISKAKRSVVPSDIESSINKALTMGWDPTSNGKTFNLKLNDEKEI